MPAIPSADGIVTEDDSPEEMERKETEKIKQEKIREEEADAALDPEERKLKEDIEILVEKVCEPVTNAKSKADQETSLESIKKEIRSTTSSMSSVPLPLKFLAPYFDTLKDYYSEMKVGFNKAALADILSVMAMTLASVVGECLKFKLEGNVECGFWGHEYVRNLAGQIGVEYNKRLEEEKSVDNLNPLIDDIVPFFVKQSAEYEAIDLLLEVEQLDKLKALVTKDNHLRVSRYLLACTDYLADHDDREKMLTLAYECSLKHESYSDALRYAIKLGSDAHNKDKILEVFEAAEDEGMKKQLGYMLSTQKIVISDFEDDDELMEIIGNVKLNEHFVKLAQELDVQPAKSPEDIYKSHLAEGGGRFGRPGGIAPNVDSARQNLASTFVNAFVNCGFGTDKLITTEGSDWLYKNKTHGMLSAAASLGMINLWNVETGFSDVDKYSFSAQNFIKAGVLLATGLLTSGVSSELDAAFALLSEHIESNDVTMKVSAIVGLGLAYAGSARDDVREILVPLIVDETQSIEVVALTCLALGLIYVGTANEDVSGSIIEGFLDRSEADLKDPVARMMCLGLSLLYLGKGDSSEAALEAISAIDRPITKYLATTIQTCAYVGTSNILEIQKLQSACSEHFKDKDDDEDKEFDPFKSMHQEVAVLGIAMISMGEEISSQMSLRTLDHFLQYGEVNIRRAVPLALGLLSISNPQLTVMDTLSKLTHDQDMQVSQNAILGLGLLGGGTNNSRIANILRQLAVFYGKEPNHLFLVRIAQGLLHLGKGLMTLDPFHSDRLLMNKVSLAGLLTVLHASFDMKNSILANRHFLLFALTTAIRPRCLITINEDGEFVPVQVRVGAAVDTVGQAGQPKSITGFQTHTTPVLLAYGERAELADDQYIPCTSVLEGFVIVRENPDSTDKPEDKKE